MKNIDPDEFIEFTGKIIDDYNKAATKMSEALAQVAVDFMNKYEPAINALIQANIDFANKYGPPFVESGLLVEAKKCKKKGKGKK